ncbi:exopolysaccharide biosynthesis polyprenyl glycosylphosphotransferase [Prosthecobacter sp.]|uniref:exopolysaccharide biosynthesis polyprenyl glycosylphosphotransferase n=1 Tax=Prosthecobacter sp. TaxID=1965333 RepID=UPI003782DAEC
MQDALNQRVSGWTPFFILVDGIATASAYFGAFVLAQLLPPDSLNLVLAPPSKEGVLLALGIIGLLLHTLIWSRDGHYMFQLLNGRMLRICAAQILFVALTVFFYLGIWRNYDMSRKLMLTFLALLGPCLLVGKVMFMKMLRAMGARIQPRLRILAVCDENGEAATRQWFSNKTLLGIHLCDVLAIETDASQESFLEHQLEEALKRDRPNLLIWRLPTNAARTERIRQIAESHGTHLAVDLLPIVGEMGAVQLMEYSQMKLVSLHKHPLVSPAHRFLKRTLDICISLPVVVLVLPFLCLGVWLVHRFFSPGPLFFKQSRSGADGQMFKIYKFRTMTVNHGRESVQARANDSRIFTGGGLMRKLSIDEMPQFLNVLFGDMSVVGPRPHMAEHDALFALECSQYALRHTVKPGVTGLAQVRGHRGPVDNSSEIKHRVTSDIEYCQNWSFYLDLEIIARTFLHVFSFHAKSC